MPGVGWREVERPFPDGEQTQVSAEILENCLSPYGLRWVHVAQMGGPVAAEPWLERVSPYSRPLVEIQHQAEPVLDLHHLRMWWPARELVTMNGGSPSWLQGRQALLWAIDKGQSLREAIVYAGMAYVDLTGRWPGMALVQSIPSGATETVTVYEDSNERILVRLTELSALPRGFVLMCEEA